MIEDVVLESKDISCEELFVEYKKLKRRHEKIIKRSDTQTKRLYELNKQLEEMAYLDYMTKLYNRRYFLDMVKRLFKDNLVCSISMIDIDNFKHINDTYGHDMGDKVIIDLANNIKNTITSNDIAARWGGEEFIIYFKDKDIDSSYKICEELREKVYLSKVDEISYSVSIGMSNRLLGISLQQMIKEADIALYSAKKNGRNKVECLCKDKKA